MNNKRLARHFRNLAIRFCKDKGFITQEHQVTNSMLLNLVKSHFPPCHETTKHHKYVFYIERLSGTASKTAKRSFKTKRRTDQFYLSREWRDIRYQALLRSNGRCDCCGARPTEKSALHVDHIKPRSKFPKLEFELSNLQVLCRDCNLGKSNIDQTDWRNNVIAFPTERIA